jgi:hypothetical protein
MAEHTPTPWAYRPNKHDDWGWIRGPVMEGEEIGELVAIANSWATQEEKDAHRTTKTYPHAANAAFIVKAVNNHERMVEALKKAEELYLAGLLNAPSGLAREVVDLRRAILTDLIAPRHTNEA